VPRRNNVARPEHRAVALRPEVRCPRQDHYPPAVSKIPAEPFVHRRCVKQRINVVVAYARTYREHVARWIDIRLGLIQPQVVESIRSYIMVANLLPPPLRRLRVRGIEIRPDSLLRPSRIGRSVWLMDQPSILLQHVVELTGTRKM